MKMSPQHKRKPSFDKNMRFKGSHDMTPPPRPIIIMKSGERMCINPACKKIFRPAEFGHMHCSDECKRIAPEKNPHNRGVAVKIIKSAMVVFAIAILTSCHGAFTDAQLRTSITNIQRDINVLQTEQMSIVQTQHELFARYRVIYKRMITTDTNRIMTPDDSVSIRTQLLMNTVSLDAIVQSMKSESAIYSDLNDRITDMVIAMDELEYQSTDKAKTESNNAAAFIVFLGAVAALICYAAIIFRRSAFTMAKRFKQ